MKSGINVQAVPFDTTAIDNKIDSLTKDNEKLKRDLENALNRVNELEKSKQSIPSLNKIDVIRNLNKKDKSEDIISSSKVEDKALELKDDISSDL